MWLEVICFILQVRIATRMGYTIGWHRPADGTPDSYPVFVDFRSLGAAP